MLKSSQVIGHVLVLVLVSLVLVLVCLQDTEILTKKVFFLYVTVQPSGSFIKVK